MGVKRVRVERVKKGVGVKRVRVERVTKEWE